MVQTNTLTVPASNHDPWYLLKSAKSKWRWLSQDRACLATVRARVQSIDSTSKRGLVVHYEIHCWRVSDI